MLKNISQHGINIFLFLEDVSLELIDGLFKIITIGVVHVESEVLSVFLELLSQGHHFLGKSVDCVFGTIVDHLELCFAGQG